MALPDLPADGLNPWGEPLRSVLTDISNRADQGISDAADAQDDVDDVSDIVDDNTSNIANHATRISTLETSNATKAADNVVVKVSGNQNIAGTKTFTSAPVVPDNSFTIAKTSGLQTALNAKAPIASPTFTGTVGGITPAMLNPSLANVDNTTDLLKPISTATQTALNLKADTSALTTAIGTHNHTGGTSGVNIPISAVTNLQTSLNAKQATLTSAHGNSTTMETSDWTINYFDITRWGAVCYVSMTITTKFGLGNNLESGNIGNKLIGTINTSSQFYDVYQGPSNTAHSATIYSLTSGADGAICSGFLAADTRQFWLSATVPYNFAPGYTFSLGGVFMLNSGV